jgi:hypothetical protein
MRAMVEEDWRLNPVETAWNLGRGDPVTMACVLLCATATTERGGYHLGKYCLSAEDKPKIICEQNEKNTTRRASQRTKYRTTMRI